MPPPLSSIEDSGRRGARFWLGWAGVMVLAVAAALILYVWTERRPIAAGLIDARLRALGLPARYKVADIGLKRQRLTNVVLGDPARPDLVADWVAIDTGWGLDGARVLGVRAGHVRARAAWRDGRLSFGALDRLLPKGGGAAGLPAISLTIDDGRLRIETPDGVAGVKLNGTGRLDGGFTGTVAAISDRWRVGDCVARRPSLYARISSGSAGLALDGPVRLDRLACKRGAARALVGRQVTRIPTTLDRAEGELTLRLASARMPGLQGRGFAATTQFKASRSGVTGTIDATAARIITADASVADTHMTGSFDISGAASRLDGRVDAHVAVTAGRRAVLADAAQATQATPVGPLVAQMARAADSAARDLAVSGAIAASLSDGHGRVVLSDIDAHGANGARLTLGGGDGAVLTWPGGAPRLDGLLTLAGGGLPELALRFAAPPGQGLRATGLVRPYAVGKSRLAIDALSIAQAPQGQWRFAARTQLSGPIGSGFLDSATLPVTGIWDGARLAVNPGCVPFAARSIDTGGVALRNVALRLCPRGGAMLTLVNGRIGGGATVNRLALTGSVGKAPMRLTATRAAIDLASGEGSAGDVAFQVGEGDSPTRLAAARVAGRMTNGVIAGTIGNGSGKIGSVPLLMTGIDATWRLPTDSAVLTVDGSLGITDAQADAPRFKPMTASSVHFVMDDGRITTTGALHPGGGTAHVADLRIEHDLGKAVGHATIAVPRLVFGPNLQPDALTPLTFGVIADVKATITGDARIDWQGDKVTSSGRFATRNADLAAAFGPVSGLSGEIVFTDLLNMVSAPNQTVALTSVNPGVAVENGVIHYRLLSPTLVEISDGLWPFAGGTLALQPTLLDFSEQHERHLTFAMKGVSAAQFLQQVDFKNLTATGTFDGTLPMIFNTRGGRVEKGHLAARPGGGTVAYVGEVSQKDLGFWGNLAFQSLKSLNYRDLTIDLNGPLDGEVITDIRFAGISQGKGAKRNFLISRLAKLPFRFNVRVTAAFRELLGSVQDFSDPRRYVRRALQELNGPVVPPPAPPPPTTPEPALPNAVPSIQPPESEQRR